MSKQLEGWISVSVAMPRLYKPVLFLCWDKENNKWYLYHEISSTLTETDIESPLNEIEWWLEVPPFPRNENE